MEFKYYFDTINTGNSTSKIVDVNGHVKRIRICPAVDIYGMNTAAQYWVVAVNPKAYTNLTDIMKNCSFWFMRCVHANAAPQALVIDGSWVEECNFNINRSDYVIVANASGVNAAWLIVLDVVPITDKETLVNRGGGRYGRS